MTEDGRAPGGPYWDDRRRREREAGPPAQAQGPVDPRYAGGRGQPGMVPPDPGNRSPYGAPLRTEKPGPRPGFTPPPRYEQPYERRQPSTPPQYGWNTQPQHPGPHQQVGPQQAAQPQQPQRIEQQPPAPPSARDGGPPNDEGPNWAPVPSAEPRGRRGPAMSMFLVVSVVVALLAGAVGAGIGIFASRNGNGTVDLSGTGGSGKNRDPGSIAAIAQRLVPSVVMIKVQNGPEGGAGTGFVVKGGYILTNNHVIAPVVSGGTMQVVFSDGRTTTGKIIGHDPTSDIAVIKPDTLDDRKALTLGNSDDLQVGDPVIAIGSPLGLQSTVTTGIISAKNRPVSTTGEGGESAFINAIQTDAAINPGNSGGPLVNAQGQVIGVNSAIETLGGDQASGKQGGSIGLGFAIPSNQVKKVAEQLMKGGKASHAVLGACMDMSFQGNGARIASPGSPTCKGTVIAPGSPAAKAGLQSGDVIMAINSKRVTGCDELIMDMRSMAPGAQVQIVYNRGGQQSTARVTLASSN